MKQPESTNVLLKLAKTKVCYKDDTLLYKRIVEGCPLLHFILSSDEHGYVKTSLAETSEACNMTRHKMRSKVDSLKDDGVVYIETTANDEKRNSKITLNLMHPLFCAENEITKDKTNEYPTEFEEDWKTYCGTCRDRVGTKKAGYMSWARSVKKHGRDAVMGGTKVYVAKCEAENTWKKNAQTWWNVKSAKYLEPEYSESNKSSSEEAVVKLLQSPIFGNILEGTHRIEIEGDRYMAEALVRLKGSDKSLSLVLDRFHKKLGPTRGDQEFKKVFMESYVLSIALVDSGKAARSCIYAKKEESITWRIE